MAEPTQDEITESLYQWGQQQMQPPPPEAPPPEGPAIYEGIYGEGWGSARSGRPPLPESAFRPFREGGDSGTLDPNVTGQAVPDEMMIQHTEQQLASMQLSQAERLRLQRLQNGAATVQQELAAGNITPMMAEQLSGQIGQQMQPLMIRQSQLPTYQRLLEFQNARQQMARQTALMQENARFRALTAEQRTHTYTDEDGRPVRMVEQPNGTLIPVRQDTGEQREQQQQQRQETQATSAAERQANHEISQALSASHRRNADGTMTAHQPAFIERINRDPAFAEAMRRYAPEGLDTNNVHAMREAYVRYLTDQRLGRQPPAQQNGQAAPSQRQEETAQVIAAILQRRARPPQAAPQPAPQAQPPAQPRTEFQGGGEFQGFMGSY